MFDGSHPVAGRIMWEMPELVDAADVPEPQKGQVRLHVLRGMEQFIKADERREAFLEKSQRIIARATSDSYQPGSEGMAVEVAGMSDDYQLFLIALSIALRMAVKTAGIVVTGEPKAWPALVKHIEGNFDRTHPLSTLIDRHREWTDDLFDVRGKVEHDAFIFEGFTVLRGANGAIEISPPRMPDGTSMLEGVPRYWQQGFELFEELVARALETKLPANRRLREVREGARDANRPVRFALV